MINSLVTDSHTKPSFSQTSKQNKTKSMANSVILHNRLSSIQKNGDSVSFGGLSGAKLANNELFEVFIKKVNGLADKAPSKKAIKNFQEVTNSLINDVGDKEKYKLEQMVWDAERNLKDSDLLSKKGKKAKVSEIIAEKMKGVPPLEKNDFVESIVKGLDKNPDLDPKIIESLKQSESEFKDLLGAAFDYIKEESPKLSTSELYAEAAKTFKVAADSFPAVKNGKFYQNEKLHNFLILAQKNQALFDASYSFLLAGLLRPAVLMATSGEKNKENNKYASAHSIASGAIGLGMAFLINTPIAKAISEIQKNPLQYLKKNVKYMTKNDKGQITGKPFDVATKYVNLGIKIALAVPQAALTIGLIPLMLKNIFGIEKGKATVKQAPQIVTGGNK